MTMAADRRTFVLTVEFTSTSCWVSAVGRVGFQSSKRG